MSWQKTKIQNLGARGPTSNLLLCGQSVEEVAEFTYLGSVQSTTGRCQPDILRRIGIASTATQSMNSALAADETPLISDLYIVYPTVRFGSMDISAERLTELEAFHMRCQRMILGICWHDFIRNTEVANTTNLPCIKDIITRRRNSLFGHVVRLDDHTPAHRVLSQVVAI